jgi:hypothetical protein
MASATWAKGGRERERQRITLAEGLQLGKAGRASFDFYPDICLITEETHGKPQSRQCNGGAFSQAFHRAFKSMEIWIDGADWWGRRAGC